MQKDIDADRAAFNEAWANIPADIAASLGQRGQPGAVNQMRLAAAIKKLVEKTQTFTIPFFATTPYTAHEHRLRHELHEAQGRDQPAARAVE